MQVAAQAQVQSLQAQTRISQAQTGFFSVQAPFSGVVSEVPVTLGDMAMPGRPLVVMHDPSALRITANVAQALMPTSATPAQTIRYEIVGQGGVQSTTQAQWLPTVDATTHTVQLRLALSSHAPVVTPGMFARVWVPVTGASAPARVLIPLRAVVRRAEMTGVYVMDAQNKPRLRQVRLGTPAGDQVEVLSGVSAGEQVVLEPARVGASR